MEYKDYYKILGVDKKATQKEIKRKYRQLARKYHPDVNPDDSEAEKKFKEINEAYQVLGDKDNRKKYDEFGQYWEHADKMGGAQGFKPGGGPGYKYQRVNVEDLSDLFGGTGGRTGGFSDFFNSLFGSGTGGFRTRGSSPFGQAKDFSGFDFTGNQSASQKGRDAEFPLELTVEEAAFGTRKHINLAKESVCQQCQGTGYLNNNLCQVCRGRGMVNKPRHIEVSVPAGVKDGFKIRMKGEGSPGVNGGSPGDLYLVVKIKTHAFFNLEDGNLSCKVPVSVTEAVLGAEIEVPSLKGKLSMKIPPGTQSDSVFRLRGQGFPSLNNKNGRGDLFVKTKIVIPEELNEEEKKLYGELAKFPHGNPRSHLFKAQR
ncbi:MAG: DnaJ C-terminal domain-containing protein [Vulcanimicrobiota bacterium]